MRLFSYDSKFSQIMLKLCYGCYLNLLWMVCSLPVFTAGAATAALYDVTLRLAREEEPPLTSRMGTPAARSASAAATSSSPSFSSWSASS